MSVTRKARSAARVGVKVQRRIVIAQALWWPTLILLGATVSMTAAVVIKRRRAAAVRPDPVLAAPPVPA